MSLSERLRLDFWRGENVSGLYKQLFNYKRLWKASALILVVIVLVPLSLLTAYEYRVTKDAFEAEAMARSARFVSKTRRTESFLLSKKLFALEFIINDNSLEQLVQPGRVDTLLLNLNLGQTLFLDLGVIDDKGRQRAYAGPDHLENADYSGQPWFKEIQNHGIFISDVLMGFRHQPHIIIAVKKTMPNGTFYVVRTAVSIDRLMEILSLEQSGEVGDAFLINHDGVLQTPSRYFGKVMNRIPLQIPAFSDRTESYQQNGLSTLGNLTLQTGAQGSMDSAYHGGLVVSYAYVENSPFILMLVTPKNALLSQWQDTKMKILIFLACAVALMIVVLMCVVTYLVNSIYIADQKRVMTLHTIEYSEKMASIGRLAAGIAHEINNPLAIINEKAGLIQDMFQFKQQYKDDPKLLGLVDSIISSVERCALITRRLLGFARTSSGQPVSINVQNIVTEVISFLGKEPTYRSITIDVDIAQGISDIVTEKGKLQQILLNIVKNAFAAVKDGGHLWIKGSQLQNAVQLTIRDDGCGIPQEDLARIFEPFFTTKGDRGGTGLGLSITYSLVSELGGKIEVASEKNKGTCFTITLPLTMPAHKE